MTKVATSGERVKMDLFKFSKKDGKELRCPNTLSNYGSSS